ncbi:pentatricopeptide repeat-containing protein At1g74630-like [Impatiens glandulifera]|uniref:pentatricopeptide repeat-containing protein At1g74630-like n=1 Tax=Impatiens glandulifera TaxID=253017 RepID=UPI001FB0896E|nr:pentatricopeptide repeat-containing protein At1g74630-like [Impatiens glandulifera]
MNRAEQVCLSLLRECRTLYNVKQIHAHACKTGLTADPFIAGKFLYHSAILISDALPYARRFFLFFLNPDVFMYNTLIRAFSESAYPHMSFITFSDLHRNSTIPPPDSFSFAFSLKAAANSRSLIWGTQLHTHALRQGLDTHIFVGTTLVSMYAECGFVTSARKVFDQMPELNVVAWNAMLTAYVRCNDLNGAVQVFETMPLKDLTSRNVMLSGYTKAGELELAKKLFMEMPMKDDVSWSTIILGLAHNYHFHESILFFRELHREQGMIRPNQVSLTGVLSSCAQAGAIEVAKVLHGYIEKAGLLWICSVNNALLDTYSKCGNLQSARLVFELMPIGEKSLVSWTCMMAGLAMHGYGEEAMKLFNEMLLSGIKPDGITFISLLYACSHSGLIKEANGYFYKMREYDIDPSVEHYGCIVDLYGRAGQLQKAYEFIIKMPIPPNAIIWRTLLGACSIHNNLELAEQVKEKLSELDPNNPDDHVSLSNVYAVAGKWNDVAEVRRSMITQRLKKNPGWSMIEVGKIVYKFVAGGGKDDDDADIRKEAYEKLGEVMMRLRVEAGYVPEVGKVLYDIEDEEKEDVLSMHSEKLAVAFGMTKLLCCKEGDAGESMIIRIIKNLRVCIDCHTMMKLISKVYGLEIVLRDRSRFHCFKNGSCSCRDYW